MTTLLKGDRRSPSDHHPRSRNAGSEIRRYLALAAILSISPSLHANPELMEMHCGNCHNDDKLKGDFSLSHLGGNPDEDNAFLWEDSLDYVTLDEMPPPEKSELTSAERDELVQFLAAKVRGYHEQDDAPKRIKPRRLNNRELANSIRDVLMIEDLGTHQPVANLLGDTLQDGFDTNGDVLGLSQFHLEQYITSFRKIVDATIFSGKRPATKRIKVDPTDFRMTSLNQRRRAPIVDSETKSIDILDIRLHAYFDNFDSIPQTGRYRMKIRATGLDRGRYHSDDTGMYPGDPIKLGIHLGDRIKIYDLPDQKTHEIELDEWIAAGTRIELSHSTDGLRMKGNGNFKFQNRIAHDYIQKNNPKLYHKVVTEDVPKAKNRSTAPSHWVHWVSYWQGPRPRLFNAEIEGPLYDS